MKHVTPDEVLSGYRTSADYLDCYRLEREMTEATATAVAISAIVCFGLAVGIAGYLIPIIAH